MRRARVYYVATLVSLFMMGVMVLSQADRLREGRNDFIPLYSGPHLLATGELYDNARLLEKEAEVTGFHADAHGYIRPPFLAALMWPLSQLPYPTAVRVWQGASLASLICFVLLWSPDHRLLTGLATAMSIPGLLVLLKGQDVHFLMLVIAVSARLHIAGKPVLAGAVFALCAAKAHLFLLTPVWILGQRDWGFLKGLLYGGTALAVLSTSVAGWGWPVEMWREAKNPMFSPSLSHMPNLHGAFAEMPASWVWELAFSVVAVWAVWTIARKSSFLPAFAAALLGGALLARHSYVLDLAILIPAVLVVVKTSKSQMLKLGGVLLLAPPLMYLAIQGPPYSTGVVLIYWALLLGWALERRLLGPKHKESHA